MKQKTRRIIVYAFFLVLCLFLASDVIDALLIFAAGVLVPEFMVRSKLAEEGGDEQEREG